jgi:hypothetical protein
MIQTGLKIFPSMIIHMLGSGYVNVAQGLQISDI